MKTYTTVKGTHPNIEVIPEDIDAQYIGVIISRSISWGAEDSAAIAVTRGQGCASPHYIGIDILREVMRELYDDPDSWEHVDNEMEHDEILKDAASCFVDGKLLPYVKRWQIYRRAVDFSVDNPPREYIVVWNW